MGRAHTALFHSRNAVMQYLQRRFQAHTKKIIYQSVSVYSEYFTLMHRLPNWRKLIYHTTLYVSYFSYYRMSSVRLPKDTFHKGLSNFTIPEPPQLLSNPLLKQGTFGNRVLCKGEKCRCDTWIYKLTEGPSVTVRNVLHGLAFSNSDHQAQA